jgi:hypothetical protein
MSAGDSLSEGQFHKWKKARNEFDQNIEESHTPHGKYTVDGNGAGRMKWSVTFPDGDYALGTTKREVRGEADLDLEYRHKDANR